MNKTIIIIYNAIIIAIVGEIEGKNINIIATKGFYLELKRELI